MISFHSFLLCHASSVCFCRLDGPKSLTVHDVMFLSNIYYSNRQGLHCVTFPLGTYYLEQPRDYVKSFLEMLWVFGHTVWM